MKRVVITGYGIVSSLGNNKTEVLEALKTGRSGIVASPEYAQLGMRSQVHGALNIDAKALIERKLYRFMGDAAAYSHIAMDEAIAHAALDASMVSNQRTGLLLGTGGASPANIVAAADTLRQRGIRRVGPYMVTKTMASTATACVGTAFKIKGVSYSISSACATSAHCIGHGAELIQMGKQDVVFAGGGEELHWTLSLLFDGMGAMSSRFNDTPAAASRPFDRDRDGFVISGGAGVVALESLDHAEQRGARIIARIGRLRRHLGRFRHGRAVRRRRGALHAPSVSATGATSRRRRRRRAITGAIYQRPRHQHAGRRCPRVRRHRRSVRRAAPLSQLHQILERPRLRRRRRP